MLNLRLPISRLLTPSEIYADKGSIAVLKMLPAAKISVVISQALMDDEVQFSRINKALKGFDVHYIEKPRGEPSQKMVKNLLCQVFDVRPDWIVAIGGGSVLDLAKSLWAYYEHPDLEDAQLFKMFGIPPLRGKAKFVAVPTTMGTGSEVSSSAILYTDNAHKHAVVTHDFLPDIVILDPELTLTTPASAIASSILDALSHATEGYVSKYTNPLLDVQAISAAKIIFDSVPKYLSNPKDLNIRLQLQVAALMAGWVQNYKIPGIGHALAHQLGNFGFSHGAACGLLLPLSIQINSRSEEIHRCYTQFAHSLGFRDVESLIAQCQAVYQQLNVNEQILKNKASFATIKNVREVIIEDALKDVCAKANPLELNALILRETLDRIFRELSIV